MKDDVKAVFDRLKAILRKHAAGLTVSEDTPTCFRLQGGEHPRHKTPLPVAWAKVGKGHVGYHLMPVYACPGLLAEPSPALKARMQGNSCFIFRVVDEVLFEELDRLTGDGLKAFRKAGYLPGYLP